MTDSQRVCLAYQALHGGNVSLDADCEDDAGGDAVRITVTVTRKNPAPRSSRDMWWIQQTVSASATAAGVDLVHEQVLALRSKLRDDLLRLELSGS